MKTNEKTDNKFLKKAHFVKLFTLQNIKTKKARSRSAQKKNNNTTYRKFVHRR